jgi:hypothetical protein
MFQEGTPSVEEYFNNTLERFATTMTLIRELKCISSKKFHENILLLHLMDLVLRPVDIQNRPDILNFTDGGPTSDNHTVYTEQHKKNEQRHTIMRQMGFKHIIRVFKWVKTLCTLDCKVIVVRTLVTKFIDNYFHFCYQITCIKLLTIDVP